MTQKPNSKAGVVNERVLQRKRLTQNLRNARKAIYEHTCVRYVIRYQWRRNTPIGPRSNWRSWRHFGVVPILFYSREDARAYMDGTAFKNMQHFRKVSASISREVLRRKIPKTFTPEEVRLWELNETCGM